MKSSEGGCGGGDGRGGRRRVAEVLGREGSLRVRLLAARREGPVAGAPGDLSPGDLLLVEEPDGGPARAAGPVLAAAGTWRADMYRLAAALGLEPCHGPAARAEAAAARADADDPALADLEELPFVTVDPPGARDLDQALHLERTPGGGYLLRYALADAAHFVRPGSALLAEAVARGASFYLPGLRLPMLPPRLSEDLVSLVAGRPRRALVVECRLGPRGEVESVLLQRARIRSRARLSYASAQRALDDPWGAGRRHRRWREGLELLAEVGEARLAEARRLGAARLHREEVEMRPDDGARGGVRTVVRSRLPVERWGEQLSLLVNVEAARILASGLGPERVQPIFRVHPEPSAEALDRLARRIERLVLRRGLDPGRWLWRRGEETLSSYLDRLPRSGRGVRVARALERQAVLVQQASRYAAEPAPHAGIGAPCYARLSSPMREVVGVFTHKEALEFLGAAPAGEPAGDLRLRAEVIEAGNRSRDLQRRLDRGAARVALDRWLAVRHDEALDGTVLGFGSDRIHVQLDEPRLDLKAYLADQPDSWRVDPLETEAVSGERAVRLGDRVRLAVDGLDRARDRWRLVVLSDPA